jgi:glucose-6-phosphate isomerase
MGGRATWERFKSHLCVADAVGVAVDPSRMLFADGFFDEMAAGMRRAFAEMAELEAGAIANPDEKRMVGHYWLRDSSRAPTPEIRKAIDDCVVAIEKFARAVHAGRIKPSRAPRFRRLLLVGIGGSALGPQFVARALGSAARDRMTPAFFDNTDPDGMDAVLAAIGKGLRETLCVVVSKSGGTRETRNGMLEARRAYEAAGLRFGAHAVAVTGAGSELDRYAVEHGWLARFPMWDWVGGRTSEMSAVGLLPAALQGFDIRGMLAGARAMDAETRVSDSRRNPAALLALMWRHAGGGHGARDMVILPYKDRLELFSRYLQQLVMESLGKEYDRDGKRVCQGIAVYGSKGSTDQHAYVQQLRDGLSNFFVTFVEVLEDRDGKSMEVEPGATSGDYLQGFLLGTRRALFEKDRESITITVPDVSAATVGKLIALYERAVGFYASLINVNAYNQPGVEAGKQAAAEVLALQQRIVDTLRARKGTGLTVEQLAAEVGARDDTETVFKILQHLSANPDHGVRQVRPPGASIFEARYAASPRGTGGGRGAAASPRARR